MRALRIEFMPNGYTRVDNRESGLVGVYNRDGSYRHGDLRNVTAEELNEAYLDHQEEEQS